MDIKDVQSKLHELEDQILHLITEFEKEAGVPITEVGVYRTTEYGKIGRLHGIVVMSSIQGEDHPKEEA